MLLLRREYRDGAEPPEIVLLHGEVTTAGYPPVAGRRFTRVVVPTDQSGRRVAYIPIPDPGEKERVVVRYRFSVVRGGAEGFSPPYEVQVPSDDAIGNLYRIPEEGGGNLPPAPGLGTFLAVLPLGEGERASGKFRYGFGAMRKKPSPSLCRAEVDAGNGPAPVIEAPEALSVLKNRPMPYFLYHISTEGTLRADKIACARITLPDPDGKILSARMIWGDPAWRATNLTLMEAKGFPPGPGGAAGEFFDEDRTAFLVAREKALSRLPVPRVFEAFVYGPSGYGIEYCFLVVSRSPDGGCKARWRNREGGGNWVVTL